MLETRNLTVRFGGHVAVSAVSCHFRAGEVTAIVGPNGAGKTTYFNLISGQAAPTAGEVILQGDTITRLSPAARARRGIGRGFQQTNLFPNLTVRENVQLTVQARLHRGRRLLRLADNDPEVRAAVASVLERVGLAQPDRKLAAELSHGDQRMLEVALLMALEPKVFMFDEPTAGMSAAEAPRVLALIEEMRRDRSRCVLLVEHKLGVIHALADRVIVLHNGRLVAEGPPQRVMSMDVVQEAYMGRDLAHV